MKPRYAYRSDSKVYVLAHCKELNCETCIPLGVNKLLSHRHSHRE